MLSMSTRKERHDVRIAFLGKDKAWSQLARQYLIGRAVELVEPAQADYGISYLHPHRVAPEVLALPRVGFINFHTAPLPDFRGVAGINFAILEAVRIWGVSAHFMDATIDTGDIIEVRRFPILPDEETALSLDLRSQNVLFQLFVDVMDTILAGDTLPREPQGAGGRTISKADFEAARRILPSDPPELRERKRRAFFYPPHEGAIEADAPSD
jgi:methionyl-tRNA formyltransferase